MSDRSLDEFAAAPAGKEADDADDPVTNDADPSVPTMRWSPDGAACDACGAVVSRRWHDGDERRSSDVTFVCADCKAW